VNCPNRSSRFDGRTHAASVEQRYVSPAEPSGRWRLARGSRKWRRESRASRVRSLGRRGEPRRSSPSRRANLIAGEPSRPRPSRPGRRFSDGSPSSRAMKPTMSEAGNGHGWGPRGSGMSVILDTDLFVHLTRRRLPRATPPGLDEAGPASRNRPSPHWCPRPSSAEIGAVVHQHDHSRVGARESGSLPSAGQGG